MAPFEKAICSLKFIIYNNPAVVFEGLSEGGHF